MDLRQIPQKEALPGDIIILSDKNNYPKHAVMFDKVVNGDTLVYKNHLRIFACQERVKSF